MQTTNSILGVDTLSDEQREKAKKILMTIGAPSSTVLIGAVVHGTSVHPMVLESGVTLIVRESPEEISKDSSLMKTFESQLERAKKNPKLTGVVSVEKIADKVYCKRQFYKETLLGKDIRFSHADVLALFKSLLSLHKLGIIHGNISKSNLSISDGIKIFDAGFSGLTKKTEKSWSKESDVRDLATLILNSEHSLLDTDASILEEAAHGEFLADHMIAQLGGRKGSFSPATETVRTGTSPLYFLLPIFFVAAFGILYFKYFSQAARSEDTAEFANRIRSGQPSQMADAASQAVLEGNQSAQQAFYATSMSGFENPKINSKLLRTGFDARWEASLSDEDRKTLLALALYDLLPKDELKLPSPEKLHPAVILSVIGSLEVEQEGSQFSKVSPSFLRTIPGKIGVAFNQLEASGVLSMEAPASRALCHIVLGDIRSEVLKTYFDNFKDLPSSLLRIRVLKILLSEIRGLEGALWNELQQPLSGLVGWFKAVQLANWDSVSVGDKLTLVSGELPQRTLTLDQYLDLLQFPLESFKKEVLAKLKLDFPFNGVAQKSLDLLAEKDVTRDQAMTFGNALLMPPHQAEPFFTAWIKTNPATSLVLKLLLARDASGTDDPFSIVAARYLSRNEWVASKSEFVRLVTHPESLARALAFAKLDINNPSERSMLEKSLQFETNERNRKLIESRLELH